MIGRLIRGPSAETATLEAIGLVKGTRRITNFDFMGPSMTDAAVDDFVTDLNKVLRGRRGDVIDRDTRRFLTNVRDGLEELSAVKASAEDGFSFFNGTGLSTAPDSENPNWDRAFEQFQRKLDAEATQLFDAKFLPGLEQKYAGTGADKLSRQAKKDPALKIGLSMGKV